MKTMKPERTYLILIFIYAFCLLAIYGCGTDPGGTSGKSETSATAQDLQNKSFVLSEGKVFHEDLANEQTTLTFGTFSGNTGSFALVSQKGTAMGQVTLGSCTFVITISSFLPNQGPQVGDQIITKPCNL